MSGLNLVSWFNPIKVREVRVQVSTVFETPPWIQPAGPSLPPARTSVVVTCSYSSEQEVADPRGLGGP